MWFFLLGVLVGGIFGVFAMALCAASGRGDDRESS